jgi:hypothetical protein
LAERTRVKKVLIIYPSRVELLPSLKFTGKMVKKINFTSKISKNGKKW